jgi:Mor family transcriptional regulator
MAKSERPKGNEIIQRMVEIGTRRLVEDLGIDERKALVVIREACNLWCEEFGGAHYYIPKDEYFRIDARDLQIWDRFDGRNTYQLAQEFDLTERQIRYILNVMRKRSVEVNQMRLPLDPPE